MDEAFLAHRLPQAAKAEHELHVIDDAESEHGDAERDQREPEIARRGGLGDEILVPQLLKDLAMVKPKPMSDSEVRMTDISVRSALMRVR